MFTFVDIGRSYISKTEVGLPAMLPLDVMMYLVSISGGDGDELQAGGEAAGCSGFEGSDEP